MEAGADGESGYVEKNGGLAKAEIWNDGECWSRRYEREREELNANWSKLEADCTKAERGD